MTHILISAANSDICQSMARIIKGQGRYKDIKITGLAPDGFWPARAFFDDVKPIPFCQAPDYLPKLKAIIKETKSDLFIPFSEAELGFFANKPEYVQELGVPVVMNSPQILKTFLDKLSTSEFLNGIGIKTPRTWSLENAKPIDIPMLIKPRRSAGSKNMAIIRNEHQFKGFIQEKSANLSNYVAQELIDTPEDEYTCAVWRMGGALRTCMLWRRLQGGMTGVAKVVRVRAIEEMLHKLAAQMTGDLILNVQLRMRGGVPYVFEINPRFSSTLMMRHKIGFQDFIWTLDYLTDKKTPPEWQGAEGTHIYRVSEEIVAYAGE